MGASAAVSTAAPGAASCAGAKLLSDACLLSLGNAGWACEDVGTISVVCFGVLVVCVRPSAGSAPAAPGALASAEGPFVVERVATRPKLCCGMLMSVVCWPKDWVVFALSGVGRGVDVAACACICETVGVFSGDCVPMSADLFDDFPGYVVRDIGLVRLRVHFQANPVELCWAWVGWGQVDAHRVHYSRRAWVGGIFVCEWCLLECVCWLLWHCC